MLYDIRFLHPSRWIVYGPSGSGKSYFVKNLLFSINQFNKPINRIVYCSGGGKPDFNKVNNIKIEFLSDISEELMDSFDKNKNNLLILDDNLHSFVNSISVSDLFTKKSHHNNITVIFLMQNLFPKSKFNRDISLNTNYVVLMKSPRDIQQIKILTNQISGDKNSYLLESYKDATDLKPFSYLLIDLNQNTPFELRVRTNVLYKEFPSIVYIKNEENK